MIVKYIHYLICPTFSMCLSQAISFMQFAKLMIKKMRNKNDDGRKKTRKLAL